MKKMNNRKKKENITLVNILPKFERSNCEISLLKISINKKNPCVSKVEMYIGLGFQHSDFLSLTLIYILAKHME